MIDLLGRRPAFRSVLIGLLCASLSVELSAAEDKSLTRLVPATAGLCVEIRDLAGALAQFQHGELAKRAAENPAIRAKLAVPLAVLRGGLFAQLGVPVDQFSVLFGDELLVAVWPEKSPGEAGPGLLILRCPDESLLQRVARGIVDRQRRAGRLAPTRRLASQGRSIEVHSIKTNGSGSQVCLAIVGQLAVVSTSSTLLEEIISADLGQDSAPAPPAASLAALPAYRAAAQRLNPAAPVRVFLNPRAWDDQMHALPRPKSGRKALVHDAISGLWAASDFVSASLAAGDSLALEVFLACQQSRLKAPLKETFASVTGPSLLAERLPAQCLAAAVGRIDLGRVYRAVLEAPGVEEYAIRPPNSLGWSAAMALAGSLGPDYELAVLAPPAARAADEPPVDWVLGIETHGVETHDIETHGARRGGDGPASAAWIVPWLRETLRLSAASATASGKQPAFRSSTFEQAGVQLTSISGAVRLPACRKLFLAQDDRLLWLGNSGPLTAQAAGAPLPTPSGNQRYRALHNPRLGAPSDLVLLDLAAIRRVLAAWPGGPPDTLANVIPLAGLADAVLLEIQCEPAFTAVSLHIACD
jgi:hypothetical protein